MDYALFQFINNLVGRWGPLDLFGVFCAEYLIFVMAFAVASLFFIWKDNEQKKIHREVVLKAFAAAVLGYIFKIIFQLIYQRPRPFITHDVLQLINNPAEASFPSGHTVLAFALAFSIYFYNKKLGLIFLFLATLVGLGRIYVGVHYPLDILGGILVGALSAFVVKKYLASSILYFVSGMKKKE
jgi:undecaprenyl-diphosphatase